MSAAAACMMITFQSGLCLGIWAVKGGWEVLAAGLVGMALSGALFRHHKLYEDRP